MGQAKAEMMRLEDLEGQALDVLARARAVEVCPIHSDTYIDNGDPDALKQAYAIGTNMVKRGEVDGTREEFMAAIKRAYENNACEECYSCAKHRDE